MEKTEASFILQEWQRWYDDDFFFFFQFIQKKERDYVKNKEDTVWSMDRFNVYFNEHIAPKKKVDQDWVYTTLTVTFTLYIEGFLHGECILANSRSQKIFSD